MALLALTFGDLRIRVADYLGLAYHGAAGTSAAAKPNDAADLALVDRICNDGMRRFFNSYPKWNWVTPTFELTLCAPLDGVATAITATTLVDTTGLDVADHTYNGYWVWINGGTGIGQTRLVTHSDHALTNITVAAWAVPIPIIGDTYRLAPATCVLGDNRRMAMPAGFYGHIIGGLTYGLEGPSKTIEIVNERAIREMYAGGEPSGDPDYCAVRPIPTHLHEWEILFYPRPSSAKIVTGRCRIGPDLMSDDLHTPNCGPIFDEAVLACCLAEAELQRKDGTSGDKASAASDAVRRAIALDSQAAPNNLGDYGPGKKAAAHRVYTGVDTYTDISGGVTVL
jgi:hypothetical protein